MREIEANQAEWVAFLIESAPENQRGSGVIQT